jgi:hypothetical protein
MDTNNKTIKMKGGEKLSLLWIFLLFNYLYCDVMTLMDSSVLVELMTGYVDGLQLTGELLLLGSILMEIPIAMVVLSRILNYKANRWANIIAAAVMISIQITSLSVGTIAMYYVFFSIIEIACLLLIVWLAWKWPKPEGN